MSCPCFDFKCCQGIVTDIVGGCVWLHAEMVATLLSDSAPML
jgi:hypothetical protein